MRCCQHPVHWGNLWKWNLSLSHPCRRTVRIGGRKRRCRGFHCRPGPLRCSTRLSKFKFISRVNFVSVYLTLETCSSGKPKLTLTTCTSPITPLWISSASFLYTGKLRLQMASMKNTPFSWACFIKDSVCFLFIVSGFSQRTFLPASIINLAIS